MYTKCKALMLHILLTTHPHVIGLMSQIFRSLNCVNMINSTH